MTSAITKRYEEVQVGELKCTNHKVTGLKARNVGRDFAVALTASKGGSKHAALGRVESVDAQSMIDAASKYFKENKIKKKDIKVSVVGGYGSDPESVKMGNELVDGLKKISGTVEEKMWRKRALKKEEIQGNRVPPNVMNQIFYPLLILDAKTGKLTEHLFEDGSKENREIKTQKRQSFSSADPNRVVSSQASQKPREETENKTQAGATAHPVEKPSKRKPDRNVEKPNKRKPDRNKGLAKMAANPDLIGDGDSLIRNQAKPKATGRMVRTHDTSPFPGGVHSNPDEIEREQMKRSRDVIAGTI